MQQLTIDIPESVLIATGQSREEFIMEAKIILAAKLFESGRLSSGKAAEICGMTRYEFLDEVGHRGIPMVDLDEEELAR